MSRKPLLCLFFALILMPSAWLAWTWRAMPELGYYHDDSLLWVSAKSLAQGGGYTIQSLPSQPAQTKYPPLYPAFLSLVWRINPSFPANLPLAALFAWLCFPPYVLLAWLYFRRLPFSLPERIALCALVALNPVAVLFSTSLMAELLFSAFFLAAILLAERASDKDSPVSLALVAGLLAALAYLTRSAALPLLVSAPLCFLLRRQLRKAVAFATAMLPGILAWNVWSHEHIWNSTGLVARYYTNYLGFYLDNISWSNLPLMFWRNADSFLGGIGTLLTFDVQLPFRHLERLVAIAAIAGVIRLTRKTGQLQFPLAALFFSGVLLIWHYPPDQRFVFPLHALLLAGLWSELKNVLLALRRAWIKPIFAERAVAAACASVLALFGLYVAFNHLSGDFQLLPAVLASHREDLRLREPAYRWIASHTPEQSAVFAYDDPMVFLYSGRRSCSMPLPPHFMYRNDMNGIDGLLASIPQFSRENNLQYVLLTSNDFYRDLDAHGATTLRKAVQSNSAFEQVAHLNAIDIYRLR